jgi:hypothetical protein
MAKAFTEFPQFFAETAQEVAFDSIIIEEGLDELEGKNVGFVTEPIILNTSDSFLSNLPMVGLNGFNRTFRWDLYNTDADNQSILTSDVNYGDLFALPGTVNDTSFVINASKDPERWQINTDPAVDEIGTYIATMTVTDPASSFMGFTTPEQKHIFSFEFQLLPDVEGVDEGMEIPKYAPYVAQILDVDGAKLTLNQSLNEFKNRTRQKLTVIPPDNPITKWSIKFKNQEKRDLSTYLHFGDDNLQLATNFSTDTETFPDSPFSVLYKLYEPLPDDIEEKDMVHVVREMLPELIETIELVPYEQEDEDVLVLRVPDSAGVDSPVTMRSTAFQSYDDLVTSDARLKKEIEDKFLSGSEKPINLNLDYSNYENYINFSSAEKRLDNFKYKVKLIDGYKAESSSLVGVNYAGSDLREFDKKIRNIKANFDGYEDYLYNASSSYTTSSLGEFPTASWPKTGSGTYAIPFEPVSRSHADFITWYGSIASKRGQIYSASYYDTNNPNRLINLLPEHIKDDAENNQFLDFMDMIGQQFDELWAYTSEIAKITDRQSDLSKGFSSDLVFNLAKSLGWGVQDGKDLLDLSRVGFGQKLSGTTYSLYTSGSLSSPPEGDISKEITKRIIASMPYLLKSKGTIGSLKGIINCYGIPSSILRVREYGGLQKENHKDQFEIARKFTKALGFRSEQFVSSSWADESQTSRKPDTVEFRFRSPTGSNQILVQKDTKWAIRLKDNGSTDNYGMVSFMISGSTGYKEISSSLLPVYDGEYHSVMLRKSKVNLNLFTTSSFEQASTLFNPPFITASNSAEYGVMKIVSSSDVARDGTKSLEHKNTRTLDDPGVSYSHLYKNDPINYPGMTASLASVSEGETYTFTAYAKVSSSLVDSVGSIALFELDSDGYIVNWTDEQNYILQDGGIKTSQKVGLNETEWKQIQVQKTIKFSNTAGLSVRFENHKAGSTIYWDDVLLRKNLANTDTIADAFNYELFVKKYDAGLDRIIHTSKTSLAVTGSSAASQSYNASWTGSGTVYVGGHSSGTGSAVFDASRFSGSMMEFRLWTEALDERYFDTHVENPKSYVGNTPSSSYYNLARRFSFDDNKTLSNTSEIRDASSNQTTTVVGNANGFGGANTFESVVDKTKTIIPNHGPNRRMATKIRIENNILSGSQAVLSKTARKDISSNDFSPLDSPKLGIYFSPVDVVNEDIVSSFANLDFNQYIGDPRDNFEESYSTLKDTANEYFQKYTGKNDFWDYMHIIKYYDQSIFKQLRKLVPARAKTHMGTLIESNIFERPKSPVQRSNPSFTKPFYEDNINISVLEHENEASQSIIKIETSYPNYSASIEAGKDIFKQPSLYQFSASDNYEDRNLYISGAVKYGNTTTIFQEATGAMVQNSRNSEFNKEYQFFYNSAEEYDKSVKRSIVTGSIATGTNYIDASLKLNYYSSKSLKATDRDPEYHLYLPFNRSFYEGVKNTINTTTDNDSPIIIRISAPTVAVPVDSTTKNLDVIDK